MKIAPTLIDFGLTIFLSSSFNLCEFQKSGFYRNLPVVNPLVNFVWAVVSFLSYALPAALSGGRYLLRGLPTQWELPCLSSPVI
jgi:hypothetical protein